MKGNLEDLRRGAHFDTVYDRHENENFRRERKRGIEIQ